MWRGTEEKWLKFKIKCNSLQRSGSSCLDAWVHSTAGNWYKRVLEQIQGDPSEVFPSLDR